MSLLLIIVALLSVSVFILSCFKYVDEGKIIIWEIKYNRTVKYRVGIGPKKYFIFPFWKFKILDQVVRDMSIGSDVFAQHGISFIYNCAILAVVKRGDSDYLPLGIQTNFYDDFYSIIQAVESFISNAIIELGGCEFVDIEYQIWLEYICNLINILLTSPEIIEHFVEKQEKYIFIGAEIDIANFAPINC